MLNSITNETTNNSIWDFNFLSGFWNKDTDKFYRIKIEETDGTCQKCKDLANKIFLKSAAVKGENDYRVEKDIQRFLDYLQKGMRE